MKRFALLKYQILDSLRNKTIMGFGIFFTVIAELLIRFGGTGEATMLSLMNVSLSVIPLFSLIFGTIYVYNNREYIELMLSQPIGRKDIFVSLYLGLVIPMSIIFGFCVALPSVLRGVFSDMLMVIGTGILMMAVFTAISFLIALRFDDKVKGMGLSVVTWLVLTILYDAIIMFLIAMYTNYPLERPVLALTLLNPVDLGRILLVLSADESAMMGFTGALYRQFFGSMTGVWVTVSMLLAWTVIPVYLGGRRFVSKDF